MSGLSPQRKNEGQADTRPGWQAELRPAEPVDLPNPADYPRLREATVEQLFKLGGERLVGQLVDLFTASAPERIEAMRVASADGGAEAAERAAHTLKSSAGNLGAMRMWAICQGIESAVTAGQFGDDYIEQVGELTHEYAIAEARLRAHLEESR